MKRFHKKYNGICTLVLTLVLLFVMLPMSFPVIDVFAAEEKNGVEIYFSVSHDDEYVKAPHGDVMAFVKITVPYFDLKEYGLQKYYFVSETYGKQEGTEDEDHTSDLEQGTAASAADKVTMLHAFIYATEVYYCGIDPKDAGQGYLKDAKHLGTGTFDPTGSTGSMYIKHFWGMDENFNYYHNYQYPLASEGWGSTADQILLHDGDIVTLGHFTSWDFHSDPLSVFNLIKAGDEIITTEVAQGSQVELTVYLAGAGGNYTTAHTPRTEKPAVFYRLYDAVTSGVVSTWSYLGEADADGKIIVDTTYLQPGEYLVCIEGQYGKDFPKDIVSTPGGIILKVIESVVAGDVNGDGSVNVFDLIKLRTYLSSTGTDISMKNADMNGDDQVNVFDLIALRNRLAS